MSSFSKKGSRQDSRKQVKRIKPLVDQYISKFEVLGEVAYRLADQYQDVDEDNLSEKLIEAGYTVEFDQMEQFLILGQYGRLREEATR